MRKKSYSVGLVGATGLIGEKFIKVLENRKFPVDGFKAFASEKNHGKTIFAFDKKITVETLSKGCFDDLDIIFFSAGADVSRKYAPIAERIGATVIDNSSAFRYLDDVPLVIPEINFDTIDLEKRKIISNPNCSTIQAVLPLKYVTRIHGVKRIIYSTYQAVSGSGKKGVKDLLLTRQGFSPSFYPLPVAENCICKIGDELENGYTEEEIKMQLETRKILGINSPISATCVRVPVENCHAVNVEVELDGKFDLKEIEKEIKSVEGIEISNFPSSAIADGNDRVFVGRLRKSTAFENGVTFITFADNTIKGAALNAVQIAEKLIEYDKI